MLEAALRLKGQDPHSDVQMISGIALPAGVGAWLGGQTHFAIFSDPEAEQLELDGMSEAGVRSVMRAGLCRREAVV